ncbi:MAG: hypothetical protein HY744_26730 [Deltaproteobacteria bacterium]|nr:hypothetical protein [Deltaproteobacteria bacterium]
MVGPSTRPPLVSLWSASALLAAAVSALPAVAPGCGGGEPSVLSTGTGTGQGGGSAAGCAAPLTKCAGKCVVADLDPENCGGCGVACEAGEVCSAGKCGVECLGGTTKCGKQCVSTDLDPQNCGGCNSACGVGQVCSGGQCGIECLGGTT